MATPYKIRVYETLLRLYNKRLSHVATKRLVIETGQSYWRTYRALRQLEDAGLIKRKSRQSGWKPALLTAAVYRKLLEIYRRTHQPVPSRAIAAHMQYTPRNILYKLHKLEAAHIVCRKSQRTGWQPVRTQPQPAVAQILDVLHRLYKKLRRAIPTRVIALELKVTTRHARRILSHLEGEAAVTRRSPRAGWLPAH